MYRLCTDFCSSETFVQSLEHAVEPLSTNLDSVCFEPNGPKSAFNDPLRQSSAPASNFAPTKAEDDRNCALINAE